MTCCGAPEDGGGTKNRVPRAMTRAAGAAARRGGSTTGRSGAGGQGRRRGYRRRCPPRRAAGEMRAHGDSRKKSEKVTGTFPGRNVTIRSAAGQWPPYPGTPVESLGTSRVSQLDAQRLEVPVVQLPEQDADRGAAQFRERLANRGQRGDDDGRLDGVVEADDRAVTGNAQPARRGLLHDPDGHAVVEREYRGRRVRPGQAAPPPPRDRRRRGSSSTGPATRPGARRRRPAPRGSPRSRSRVATQPSGPAITPIRRCPRPSRCAVACVAPEEWAAQTTGMPSGTSVRGSTTTKGKPCSRSARSSAADSSGSTSTAPSASPLASRSMQRGLPLVGVPGGAEHGPQVVLVERFRGAGQDLREVAGMHHRHRDADQAGGRRRPGPPAARRVAALAQHPLDGLPGLRRTRPSGR